MRRWPWLSLLLLGIILGFLGHELIRPDTAVGDRRAQNVLLDYDQQKDIYGNAVGVAQAVMQTRVAVSEGAVFVVQNGKVWRSTQNGDPGTWEMVLN